MNGHGRNLTDAHQEDSRVRMFLLLGLPLVLGMLLTEFSLAWLYICWLVFTVLAYWSLEEAVLLLLFLLPCNMQRSVAGEDYAIYADLAKLLLLPAFLLIPKYRRLLFASRLCRLFCGTFLVNVCLALPRAVEVGYSAKLLTRQFTAMSFGLIVAVLFRTREQLSRALKVVLVSAGLTGAYSLYQVMVGGFGGFWNWANPEIAGFLPWEGRATGFLSHPNALGGFMTLALSLALPLLICRQAGNWTTPLVLGSALMLAGLLASFSRGAWASFAVAVLAVCIMYCRGPELGHALRIAGVGSFGIYLSGVGDLVYKRAMNVEEVSELGRLFMWAFSFDLFRSSPILGIGYGNWRGYFFSYVTANFPAVLSSPAMIVGLPHNLYLGILAESGVVGIVLTLGPFVYLGYRAFRSFALLNGFGLVLAQACGVAIISAFCDGMVESWMDTNPSYLTAFWVIVGLLIATLESGAPSSEMRLTTQQ